MTPLRRKSVVLMLAFMVFFICVWPTINLQKTELRAEALAAMAFAVLLWAGTTLLQTAIMVCVRRYLCPGEDPLPRGVPDLLLLTSCRLC